MSTLETILLVIGLAIGVVLLMVLAYYMGKYKGLVPIVLTVVGIGIFAFSIYCFTDLNYYYNAKGGVHGVLTGLFHANAVEGEELEFSLLNIELKQIDGDQYGAKITINRTITMEDDKDYNVCVNGVPCTTSEVDKIHAQATYAYTFYDKQMTGFEDTLTFSFAFYPNYTMLSVTTEGGSEAVKNWNSYFQKNNFVVTIEESMFKFESYEQEDEVVDYCITYYVDNKVYQQQLVKSNETFTLINAPEKKGYTFDGWADAEGNIVEITRTTQNIDLYAVYSEFEGQYLDWEFSGEWVTNYTGNSTELVIPSSYSVDEYGNFIEGNDFAVNKIDFRLSELDCKVTSLVIPSTIEHHNWVYLDCETLESIEIQGKMEIEGSTWETVPNLQKLILNFDSVALLFNNVDWNVGILNHTFNIYVPDDLVDDYIASEGWSRLASDRIKSISELN